MYVLDVLEIIHFLLFNLKPTNVHKSVKQFLFRKRDKLRPLSSFHVPIFVSHFTYPFLFVTLVNTPLYFLIKQQPVYTQLFHYYKSFSKPDHDYDLSLCFVTKQWIY